VKASTTADYGKVLDPGEALPLSDHWVQYYAWLMKEPDTEFAPGQKEAAEAALAARSSTLISIMDDWEKYSAKHPSPAVDPDSGLTEAEEDTMLRNMGFDVD
jgi:hypothetical protein